MFVDQFTSSMLWTFISLLFVFSDFDPSVKYSSAHSNCLVKTASHRLKKYVFTSPALSVASRSDVSLWLTVSFHLQMW
jgi:hypothetical protein